METGISREWHQGHDRKASYFDSPRAEIRAEALESMLQLGERAAIPYLLKAAENAPTPDEAVALTEGAEWLELPTPPNQ